MNSRRSGSGGDAAARFFGLMLLLLEGLSHRVHELAVISEGAHVEFIKKSKRRLINLSFNSSAELAF
jgi:hypothetical protein